MKLTEGAVERILGKTPCVCGDLEQWHPGCYHGKTDAEIAAGYRRAFAKARRFIRRHVAPMAAAAVIAAAAGEAKR